MVTEISIALRATADTLFPVEHGRAINGWLYHVLAAGDPAAATPAHDGSLTPFTCSRLAGPVGRPDGLLNIDAGDHLALRITTLDPATVRALELGLGACSPEVEFAVPAEDDQGTRVLRTVMVDASLVTRLDYVEFGDLTRGKHWSLHFRSPTAFDHWGQHVVVPLPELIFANLLRKWNSFAGATDERLTISHEALLSHVAQSVVVSDIEALRTEPQGGAQLDQGVVGSIGLAILGDLPCSVFRQITALLHFCRYAGLGKRTTEGWGQAEAEIRVERTIMSAGSPRA